MEWQQGGKGPNPSTDGVTPHLHMFVGIPIKTWEEKTSTMGIKTTLKSLDGVKKMKIKKTLQFSQSHRGDRSTDGGTPP